MSRRRRDYRRRVNRGGRFWRRYNTTRRERFEYIDRTMGYSIHAGGARESEPERRGSLYECEFGPDEAKKQGQEHAWYDFFAQAVSTDREGDIDHTTVGCIHPAARSSGKESRYKPSVKNFPPRKGTGSRASRTCKRVTERENERVLTPPVPWRVDTARPHRTQSKIHRTPRPRRRIHVIRELRWPP